MTPLERARALIDAVDSSLKRGVKHYNKAGDELKTVREVIECLSSEKEVTVRYPEGGGIKLQ